MLKPVSRTTLSRKNGSEVAIINPKKDWQSQITYVLEWLQQDHVKLGLWLMIAAIVGLWLGITLQSWWQQWRGQRQGQRVFGRGKRMEHQAAKLLEDCGYRILEKTPKLAMMLRIEDSQTKFDITPDFLVEKDGEQFIVEVKFWEGPNPAIHNAHIRRQVIEYLAASGLPCLLLEMPEGYVTKVDANLDQLS